MTRALVPTGPPAISDLIRTFLDGLSPHTLTAYGRDLDDFARFLTGSRQEALGRFFSQPAPAANADVLRYRHDLVARQLAPATINRRLAAIRSLTKLARLLGVVPWAIEVQDVPQETLRDTRGPGVETVAEMMRLAAAPRDSYAVRNVAMLRVMFDLALRVSEVVRLDVVDLELDRGALWVSGKGRAEKEVLSLPANTQEAITAWLRVRGTKEGPLFLTLGPRAGARVRRLGQPVAAATGPPIVGPYQARDRGFDLHAGVCVPAEDRDRLERIARYTLRPPVAQERLQWTDEGQVRLKLRHPWSDGTTHLLFDPVELLERLAALTPRPRIHLMLYHGVLAPRAAWRARVAQFEAATDNPAPGADEKAKEPADAAGCRHGSNYLWAELMRRSLGLDVLACPRCGGRLTLIALIDDPAVVGRVLQHLGLSTEVPKARPARAPPVPLLDGAPATDAAHEFYVDDPA